MTAQISNRAVGTPAAQVPLARRPGMPAARPGQHRGLPPQGTTQEILSSIPASQVAAVIRPVLGRMIREMIKEIQEGVPAYAQPLQGEFGKILVTCVERAVLQVAEGIGKPQIDKRQWEDWFRHVGKVEFHEGRSMDSLQTAVRIGTRVGWRHIRAAGAAIGIPTETLFSFADVLFQYGDELCAVAIAGYSEAQARASGTMERRRQRLLKLLLSGEPASAQSIADLASVTDWELPERVAVVALEYREDQHQLPESSLGRDVLVDFEGSDPCLIVSDPERQLAGFELELAGRRAAIGPLVPLADAANSYACARRALVLAARGVLQADGVIQCADHMTTLALCADEFLLTHLTNRALSPFDGLTDKQKERLCETLLAWLGTRGGINETATRLGVHPQTVRYRMNQVSKLLGDRLDDPDYRLMLAIALRATRLVDS
jgi:hypothetical protein